MPKWKTPTTARGRLLRRVRKYLNLTQEQMAWEAGVDRATISFWETGARPMPWTRLDTLIVLVLRAVETHGDQKEGRALLDALRAER